MPPKRIPKPLKKAILASLFSTKDGSLPSAAVADRVNNNPAVPARMMKTPKQMAYLLNRMIRDYPGIIETRVLNRNGASRHGGKRFRKGYHASKGITLAEAEQVVGVTRKKQNQAKKPDSE